MDIQDKTLRLAIRDAVEKQLCRCERLDTKAVRQQEAIEALQPKLPIFFSVHGTGDEEAIKMLKDRLGVTPLATMDDACKAAVGAAAKTGTSQCRVPALFGWVPPTTLVP